MAHWRRTHTCGELREEHVGRAVTLNGWVNTYRAYNDQIFVDLRDRYGLTQVVIEADHPELFKLGQEIRNEWVLSVRGKVRERLPNKHNPKLATGDIEVVADELQILNRCPTPPFDVMSVPLEDHLGEAVAVTEIDEHLLGEVPGDEHPAVEGDGLPEVVLAQLAAGVCPLPLGHD